MISPSKRESAIIQFNKTIIGKSLNSPTAPRWAMHAKYAPSFAPPSFAARNEIYTRRIASRGDGARQRTRLKNRSNSVVDQSEIEMEQLSRSVSRKCDRRLVMSRHNCFRTRKASEPELITAFN